MNKMMNEDEVREFVNNVLHDLSLNMTVSGTHIEVSLVLKSSEEGIKSGVLKTVSGDVVCPH